jgi:hypothetical protein
MTAQKAPSSRYSIEKLMKINWFHDIGVRAELVASYHVSGGSQHHYWDHLQALVGLDLMQDPRPIHLGSFRSRSEDRGIFEGRER